MRSVKDGEQYDPSIQNQGYLKSEILGLLGAGPVSWAQIDDLLRRLPVATTAQRCCMCDDPMGRLLLGAILCKCPPTSIVKQALRAFPCALDHNAAAFFTACRDAASSEIVSLMTRHLLTITCDDECPFPWILSEFVSVEGAQAILQVYPQGVLKQSQMLNGYCLLDYMLLSPDMVGQRSFDMDLWSKFKLILIAAEYCQDDDIGPNGPCITPVHLMLRRVFSTPGFFANMQQTRHILWLMHQLAWNDRWVFEKRAPDGKYPLHFVLSQKCAVTGEGLLSARALVKLLLEAHPVAAKVMLKGRLPLHMAIENGWPCHDLLLSVYPEALDIADPRTDLFPFQASAMDGVLGATRESPPASSMMDLCDLDVTYELLRANPSHATGLQVERAHVKAHA